MIATILFSTLRAPKKCLLNFSLPKMYVFHSLIPFCNLSLYLLFQEENIQRCSMSADSQVENSGSEDSTDDDYIDVKENGYHDAENEVDKETDDDVDCIQSGKLSESSGYAGSDLYDYKAFGGDDSNVGSSSSNHAKTKNVNLNVVPDTPLSEDQNKQRKGSENPVDENDASNLFPSTESYRSMGEILSSMDPGNHLPMQVTESGFGKQTSKASSASFSSKRSTFWGRSNPRKTPSMESVDSSGEEDYLSLFDLCRRFLQQYFDSTLAFVNHERKQRTKESLLGTNWRNIKGQVLASSNGTRQPSRKKFLKSSPSNSKSIEASTSMSVDDLGALDSASVPSTSRATEVRIKLKKCCGGICKTSISSISKFFGLMTATTGTAEHDSFLFTPDDLHRYLYSFLSSPYVTFVGIQAGVGKLMQDHLLPMGNVCDLCFLATTKLSDPRLNQVGLTMLCRCILGLQFEKDKWITRSLWDNLSLSVRQVEYTALDAFLSCEIGRRLMTSYYYI
ncbi:Rho GTPase-activating protein 7 [Glycine max]|nr:Rho GTPase-activating protein 7 [Glycine max]